MGLNDEILGTMISNIIQQDPIPKVKQVLARICKEEQHRNLARTVTRDRHGGARISLDLTQYGQQTSRLTCGHNHCNKFRHEAASFQLVG